MKLKFIISRDTQLCPLVTRLHASMSQPINLTFLLGIYPEKGMLGLFIIYYQYKILRSNATILLITNCLLSDRMPQT